MKHRAGCYDGTVVPTPTGARRACWVICCVALLACGSDRGEGHAQNEGTSRSEKRALLTLDLATREIEQPIGPELAEPARQTYVRVEIVDVHNPRGLRLTFELRYRLDNGKEVLLGTFALFPPDHPGDFLLATRGALRN